MVTKMTSGKWENKLSSSSSSSLSSSMLQWLLLPSTMKMKKFHSDLHNSRDRFLSTKLLSLSKQRRVLSWSYRVTTFGKISPLWQNIQSLWQNFEGIFSIWQILKLTWRIVYAIGLLFITVLKKNLKSNLAIWSHCSWIWMVGPFLYPSVRGIRSNDRV